MNDLFDALGNFQGVDSNLENNGLSEVLSGFTPQPVPGLNQGQVITPTTQVAPEVAPSLQEEVSKIALRGLTEGVATPPPTAAPKTDLLAADKNGFNLPKTGQANTTGAVQRINANASGANATATQDVNGQITITGSGPTVQDARKQVAQGPLGMTQALTQLRQATTLADANVIMDSIRQTAAAEQAKINGDALAFAGNKIGIPGLEKSLREAEMADRSDLSWYPGIGDSPITARIRNEVQSARGQASSEADKYLATNLSSGVLKNNLTAAAEAMSVIKQRETRSENIADNLLLRNEAKRDMQEQNAQDVIESMNAKEIGMLKILNPSLQNDNTIALARAAGELSKPSGANRLAAIRAAAQPGGQELIALAVENNADAKTLLLNSELQKNPFADQVVVTEKLRKIQQFALDPNFVKKSAQAKFGNINSPEAKEYITKVNTQKLSTDPKEKALAHRERITTAIDLERQQATNNFLADTTKWGANDPTWMAAVTATVQSRGSASFEDVMTTYVGSSLGSEAQAKLMALSAIASERTAAQANSIFGRPESMVIQKMITNKARSIGVGSAITDMLTKAVKSQPFDMNTMRFGPGIGPGVSAAIRLANPYLQQQAVAVDPTTGLPFAKQ